MKQKIGFLATFMLLILAVVSTGVSASVAYTPDQIQNNANLPSIQVMSVEVNGHGFSASENDGSVYYVQDRDTALNIVVTLLSHQELSSVEARADFYGYEYNDYNNERLSDATEPFDVKTNRTYQKELSIKLPDNMDKSTYKLKITVSGPDTQTLTYDYNIEISSSKHELTITDASLYPGNQVQAGRSLIAIARIKNYGDKTESDVKVSAEIPGLVSGVSGYINEIAAGDTESSEELALRIPECAAEGTYTLRITTQYDDNHGNATKEIPIAVVASDACVIGGTTSAGGNGNVPQDKTIVSVDSNTQTITAGEGGVIYPITITNEGTTSKSYIIEADGVDWASVKMSPSNVVVLNGGESKAVYLYVSANEDAAVGEHMFGANIKSGNTVLQTVNFKADITASKGALEKSTLLIALEYAAIVLVVILVIVGIVLAVQKVKKGEGSGEELAQTYY